MNYSGSGIKTLRAISILSLIIHLVISLFCLYLSSNVIFDQSSIICIGIGIIVFLNGLFTMSVGLVLATIAESSLYQKQKLELEEFLKD